MYFEFKMFVYIKISLINISKLSIYILLSFIILWISFECFVIIKINVLVLKKIINF